MLLPRLASARRAFARARGLAKALSASSSCSWHALHPHLHYRFLCLLYLLVIMNERKIKPKNNRKDHGIIGQEGVLVTLDSSCEQVCRQMVDVWHVLSHFGMHLQRWQSRCWPHNSCIQQQVIGCCLHWDVNLQQCYADRIPVWTLTHTCEAYNKQLDRFVSQAAKSVSDDVRFA